MALRRCFWGRSSEVFGDQSCTHFTLVLKPAGSAWVCGRPPLLASVSVSPRGLHLKSCSVLAVSYSVLALAVPNMGHILGRNREGGICCDRQFLVFYEIIMLLYVLLCKKDCMITIVYCAGKFISVQALIYKSMNYKCSWVNSHKVFPKYTTLSYSWE